MQILPQIDAKDKGIESLEDQPVQLLDQLNHHTLELDRFVRDAARHDTAVHEVEQEIWCRILALGRETLALYFQLMGDGNMGEEVQLPDGRRVRRLPELHLRPYQSIFGSFELARAVYGTREGQKIEFVPLDQRLGLPEGKFSYVLQDWDQSFAVESPYAEVDARLQKILGFPQSVDSLERMNRQMAELVVDYWDSLEPPPASEEGELMVGTGDGKGVVVRRPATTAPIEDHQETSDPKPGAKKMALLGATYTVDRYVRTPEQVVDALFRKPHTNDNRPRDRPRPRHKRVRASLERSPEGTMEPANLEIFGWMAMEVEQRNPDGEKPLVILMDGQESLWDAATTHLPDNAIPILDLLHVTPRLWKAAYLFHPKGSASVTQFVRYRVLRILRGETASVITGLRRMATTSGLRGRKRKGLEKICKYFENNQHRMCYDQYLAAGYPIATGVIEGACRHLVKDRMERTGMHWVLEGAQAMLDLRSVHLADQWDEFTAFRIRKELERLYPYAELTENMRQQKIA